MIACSLAIMCFATIAGLTQANSSSTTATTPTTESLSKDPPGSNRMIRGGKGGSEEKYGRKLMPGGGIGCDPSCSSDEFCLPDEGLTGGDKCVSFFLCYFEDNFCVCVCLCILTCCAHSYSIPPEYLNSWYNSDLPLMFGKTLGIRKLVVGLYGCVYI